MLFFVAVQNSYTYLEWYLLFYYYCDTLNFDDLVCHAIDKHDILHAPSNFLLIQMYMVYLNGRIRFIKENSTNKRDI